MQYTSSNINGLIFLQNIIMYSIILLNLQPYLIAYLTIFELFLEINTEEKFSNEAEFFKTIQYRLFLKINNNIKLPLQIVSVDLIKNAYNFLKSEKLIQVYKIS
jgi:hypothetical protein